MMEPEYIPLYTRARDRDRSPTGTHLHTPSRTLTPAQTQPNLKRRKDNVLCPIWLYLHAAAPWSYANKPEIHIKLRVKQLHFTFVQSLLRHMQSHFRLVQSHPIQVQCAEP